MRILVTGGVGLLGWRVTELLSEEGYDTYSTYHVNKPPKELPNVKWIQIDLGKLDEVSKLVSETRPDIIIHLAAYTDVDGCEINRDLAYRVNYEATKYLAKKCRGVCEYFIYVSTDYVFDGSKGLYKENDLPNPINYYGLTKLLGEVAVENALENYLIIRPSNIYGCGPGAKKGFALGTLERLLARSEVKAIHDQYLSPTYFEDLAKNIVKILETRPKGILHLAGERVSRYKFAVEIARALGLGEELVKPISLDESMFRARRPRDSSLDTSLAKSLGLFIRPLKETVKDFVERCSGYAIQGV